MMTIKIIINGAYGKMGTAASNVLTTHQDFIVVARLGHNDSLEKTIKQEQADVVLDFTNAASVYANSLTIINHGARPVIGTSGLTNTQIEELTAICAHKKLGGIIVPNFSIGAVLMMHFSALAARFLPEAEIIEMHHQQKLDAPSGTALKTAEMIADSRVKARNALPLKEIIPHARGSNYHDVNIHAIRLPGVLARQEVIFGNTGETLTISHNSIDRSSFMPGVVLACQRVLQLNTLHYGLEQLIL